MSLELCVLGSGSSGNCSVLRTPGGAVLIDAGLGPRVTEQRLRGTGVKLADIRAICLTHLDHDHFNSNWISTICHRRIRVFVNSHRLNDLRRSAQEPSDGFDACIQTFGTTKSFEPIEGLNVRAIKLAHDRDGSHGFCVDGFGVRIGYATDLGHVPDGLIEHFQDVDLLALESNYDPDMQVNSPRPRFLKQRIMGGAGHLSNEQAFNAIRAILDRAERVRGRGCLPSHIVLLHRSRQCNCPKVVRHLFNQDPRVAERLTLSDQYRRTEWLRPVGAQPRSGEQLMLSF
jgi:phosphoribosyl 1,2-cyclic phosphodiesterase